MMAYFYKDVAPTALAGRQTESHPIKQLALVCRSTPRAGFKDYVLKKWRKLGYKVSEITSP
jgi:hypothetical protein